MPGPIVIVGHFRVHSEDASIFAEILRPHVADVTTNARGCIYYDFAIDVADPALFRNMECWADKQALDEHLSSARFAAALNELKRVRVLDRQTQLYEIAAQRPLVLGEPDKTET